MVPVNQMGMLNKDAIHGSRSMAETFTCVPAETTSLKFGVSRLAGQKRGTHVFIRCFVPLLFLFCFALFGGRAAADNVTEHEQQVDKPPVESPGRNASAPKPDTPEPLESGKVFKDNPDLPWHISSDTIKYDKNDDVYIAEGHVVVARGDKSIEADFVRFDHKALFVKVTGNVIFYAGEDRIYATRIDMDLTSGKGTVFDGHIFLKQNNFHIKAETIQKLGENTYWADTGSLTTCDGGSPDWKITARNLNVTIHGYGTASDVTFYASDIPVLYTPYLRFPAKSRRESGLLAPQLGVSDRKGFEYIQPWFWDITDHMDATVYFHEMAKRGEKLGLEFRYNISPGTKGIVMADYFNDRKLDENNTDDYGYTDDAALRTNTDRYWFRMKMDQELPAGFRAKVDLDILSDQDYLHEFNTGITGYEDSKNNFIRFFGRDFDEYDDPIRANRLYINRNWNAVYLGSEFRFNDNVIKRRQPELYGGKDDTLSEMPHVEFAFLKQSVLGLPVMASMDNDYVYYFREDGIKGHRFDFNPRLHVPMSFQPYFYLEPQIGFHHTYWDTDREDLPFAERESMDDTQNRSLYDVTLDLSTSINRVFNLSGGSAKTELKESEITDKLRHLVIPRLYYTYIPDKDQDDLPFYDESDRILKRNDITFSLTNVFTLRDKRRGDKDDAPLYSYREIVRLKLEETYDIDEAREDDPLKWNSPDERQPFSPTYGELTVTPGKYFNIKGDISWDFYENRVQTHNLGVNLWDIRNDTLYIAHRYKRKPKDIDIADLDPVFGSYEDVVSYESLFADVNVRVTDKIFARSQIERNLDSNETIWLLFGIRYETQCWSADINYIDDGTDQKYAFYINLYGLGKIGLD